MAADQNIDLKNQQRTIINDSWTINLLFEPINKKNNFYSQLKITTTNKEGYNTEYLLSDICGGCYLYISNGAKNAGQTVKLSNNSLILSLGFTLLSFNVEKQKIDWQLKMDDDIYEFYDLKDDYLLRSEIFIYRISNKGDILWRFSGRDIWVNIDNPKKSEVKLENNKIVLTDFEGNIYILDYNGQILEDIPVLSILKTLSVSKVDKKNDDKSENSYNS